MLLQGKVKQTLNLFGNTSQIKPARVQGAQNFIA